MSTLKRSFAVVLCLVMVIGMLPVNAFAEEHVHNYSSAVTAPTCEATGYTTYTCDCGDSYTSDEVAATGHSMSDGTVTTEATCATAGVLTKTCGACGATDTEVISATGNHNYVDGVCTGCTAAEPNDAKHTHEWNEGEVTTEASCTDAGVMTYTCQTEGCGETKTETIPATGHSFAEGKCACGELDYDYDWCTALGCTEEAHNADCPWGPCTITPGCELVKGHELLGAPCDVAITLEEEIVAYFDTNENKTRDEGETGFASLADAVAAADSGDTITLKASETVYELPLFSGKELTFKGENKETVIINDAPDARAQGWLGSTFHFENLTAKGATTLYYGLANGVVEVTYTDCIVNNLRLLFAEYVSFNRCTFNNTDAEHCFWTYGATNITVSNSTLNYADRAVNCYIDQGAGLSQTLTFNNCKFNYTGSKDDPEGAVEINSSTMDRLTLNMNGCTAPDKGAMWYISQWDSKQGQNTVVYVNDNLAFPEAVAKIGTKGYPTLAEAVAVGGEIVLQKDITLSETLTIPAGKTVTLDLNGKTVSMADASGAAAALITNKGTLTITNGVGDGKLTFNSTTPSASNAYASNTISNLGVLTINGGTIENTGSGGACYALDTYYGSSVTINGGKLVAQKTAVRMYNYLASGKTISMNITGGTIESKNGYGLMVKPCGTEAFQLNISGGTISTQDTTYNLAVYISPDVSIENSEIKVTGGTFDGAFAMKALACTTMGKGKVSISGGNFETVACYGTPVYGFITGGTFKNGEIVTDVSAYVPMTHVQDQTTGTVSPKPEDEKVETEAGSATIDTSSATNSTAGAENPVSEEELTKISDNTATSAPEVINSLGNALNQKSTETLVQDMNTAGADAVVLNLDIDVEKLETTTSSTVKITYDVTPILQPVKQVENSEGKIENQDVGTAKELHDYTFENAITFNLPLPGGTTAKFVNVWHEGTFLGAYEVKGEGNAKYITLESYSFSEWAVELLPDTVTSIDTEVNGVGYPTLKDALAVAKDGQTIKLLEDITVTSTINVPASVTIDGGEEKHSLSTGASFSGDYMVNCGAGATLQNLKINNTKADKTIDLRNGGTLDNIELSSSGNYGVMVAYGTVTITDSSLNTTGSYNIFSDANATATVSIKNNTFAGTRSAMLYTAGEFSGNKDNTTKGVSVADSKLTVTGNTFTGNRAMSVSTTGATISGNNFGTSTVEMNPNSSADLSANYWNDGNGPAEGQIDTDPDNNNPTKPGTFVVNSYYETITDDGKLEDLTAGPTAVAEVNGTYYDNFATAIAAADGKTVTLLKDVTLGTTIEVENDVTLDLNGKTINAPEKTFAIENSGTLTIENSSSDSTGLITGYAAVKNNGNLTIESGKFMSTAYEPAADAAYGTAIGAVHNSGTATINGGSFDSNRNTLINTGTGVMTVKNAEVHGDSRAIYTNGASVTIESGTYTADYGDSVVYAGKGTVAIAGGTFTHTQQTNVTEAVFVASKTGNAEISFPAGIVGAEVEVTEADGEVCNYYYATLAQAIDTLTKPNADAGAYAKVTLHADGKLPDLNNTKILEIDANGYKLTGPANIIPAEGYTVGITNIGKVNKTGLVLQNLSGTPGTDQATIDANGVITAYTSEAETASGIYGTIMTYTYDKNKQVIDEIVMLEVAPSQTTGIVTLTPNSARPVYSGQYMVDLDGDQKLSAKDFKVTFPTHDNRYTKGTKETLYVESTGFFQTCTRIYVDSEELKEPIDLYIEAEKFEKKGVSVGVGCTKLDLTSKFLNQLDSGKYTVVFVHEIDGETYISDNEFVVKPSPSVADETNPKTGDSIFMAVSVMTFSAAAMAVLLIGKKKMI